MNPKFSAQPYPCCVLSPSFVPARPSIDQLIVTHSICIYLCILVAFLSVAGSPLAACRRAATVQAARADTTYTKTEAANKAPPHQIDQLIRHGRVVGPSLTAGDTDDTHLDLDHRSPAERAPPSHRLVRPEESKGMKQTEIKLTSKEYM